MEYDLITLIGQLGFPIAVASYTLVVLNQTVKKNTECLIEMKTLIQGMKGGSVGE
ncbi:YvrJ family protein [Dehalobacter restrictus]|uniref:YvrJ family protein n=1 Tax=Dehalobacter restrictus TaxID=55583 RepID=UPI00338EC43F